MVSDETIAGLRRYGLDNNQGGLLAVLDELEFLRASLRLVVTGVQLAERNKETTKEGEDNVA